VAKCADDGGDGDDMLCAGSLRGLEKVTSVLSGGAPRPSPWMDRGNWKIVCTLEYAQTNSVLASRSQFPPDHGVF